MIPLPFRIAAALISRFFLDLREVNDTISYDDSNGVISTVHFVTSQVAGNLGEPLDYPNSTWVSGAWDDVARENSLLSRQEDYVSAMSVASSEGTRVKDS